MSEPGFDTQRRTLTFAAITEAATGLALILAPGLVVALLLGEEVDAPGLRLGRCFGIALLALATACWPARPRAVRGAPERRAMLLYNASIAIYLFSLGAVGNVSGPLLWPAVIVHGIVAFLLLRSGRAL